MFLAQSKVIVDGELVQDGERIVHKFSHIKVDGKVLQQNTPRYIMLHKPIGVVCATKDEQHQTVIDLLSTQYEKEVCEALHIVGRLDLNTSGLVLLTNDSRWSSQVTSPEEKVEKRYLVTLKNELSTEYIAAFAQGMYFEYEDITTLPAKLCLVSSYVADVSLIEGRYHQIKRMFGRFRNPVVALHRYSIGKITLDDSLPAGESRDLSAEEVQTILTKIR